MSTHVNEQNTTEAEAVIASLDIVSTQGHNMTGGSHTAGCVSLQGSFPLGKTNYILPTGGVKISGFSFSRGKS